MSNSSDKIISDIKDYIRNNGSVYSSWYVGIAKDPRDRLFNGHNVHQNGDAWIYREAESSQVARDVENYFINTLGTDGGPGGGDWQSNNVYAYKKNSHTDP